MAKKNAIKDVTPVVDQLKIDELSLLRLTKAAEKGRAAGMELQLASNTLNGMFQKWLAENAEAKKMNDRIVELQAEIKKTQADYNGLVERISAELKIDMKEYAYDDETGVLHLLPVAPPNK